MTSKILIVEDDEMDQMFITSSLKKHCSEAELEMVDDGQAALDYLDANAPPRLILLDLNLPVLSGKDVLDLIKAHKAWKRIPVLIFSTADVPSEIKDCYNRHANAYLVKPSTMAGYKAIAEGIRDFWLGVVKGVG